MRLLNRSNSLLTSSFSFSKEPEESVESEKKIKVFSVSPNSAFKIPSSLNDHTEKKEINYLLLSEEQEEKISCKSRSILTVCPELSQITCSVQPQAHSSEYLENFFCAVTTGDLNTVQEGISSGIDVNIKNLAANEETPLIRAIQNDQLKMVGFLLSQKDIDLTVTDAENMTALMWASTKDQSTIVKMLLAHSVKININAENRSGKTALLIAAALGRVEIVKTLLGQKEIYLNKRDNFQETALTLAIIGGHFEVVKILVKQSGVDLNTRDKEERTPLMKAACLGYVDIVQVLANARQTFDIRKWLFTECAKVDPLLVDTQGRTALMLAVLKGHINVVQFLYEEFPVKDGMRDRDGMTMTMLAVMGENSTVLEFLVRKGEDVNQQNNLGKTPLALAAERNSFEMVYFLQEEGKADLFIQDFEGKSPLMLAIENGHVGMTRCLAIAYPRRTDLNRYKDHMGRTALMLAVKKGNLEIVESLVRLGDDPRAEGFSGETAVTLAVRARHLPIVEFFIAQGVNVEAEDGRGKISLILAAEAGDINMVQCLLKEQVNINIKDNQGITPLMSAAINGHYEVVKYLSQQPEIKIHMKSLFGYTAKDLAIRYNQSQIVEYLNLY